MMEQLAKLQKHFLNFLRISIAIVMLWIGGLKIFAYEAEGIVPFVANSPVMSFFYKFSTPEYKSYMHKEGELIPEHQDWHRENGTYVFSMALGAAIASIGLLVLLGTVYPLLGLWGGLLTFGMAGVTLSFLITTPETFVGNLGGPEHGFPYLSGAGRLVIKDVIMMAAGLVVASDAAQRYLRVKKKRQPIGCTISTDK